MPDYNHDIELRKALDTNEFLRRRLAQLRAESSPKTTPSLEERVKKEPRKKPAPVPKDNEHKSDVNSGSFLKKYKEPLKLGAIAAVTYFGLDYLLTNYVMNPETSNLLSQGAAVTTAYIRSNSIQNKFTKYGIKAASILYGGALLLFAGVPLYIAKSGYLDWIANNYDFDAQPNVRLYKILATGPIISAAMAGALEGTLSYLRRKASTSQNSS